MMFKHEDICIVGFGFVGKSIYANLTGDRPALPRQQNAAGVPSAAGRSFKLPFIVDPKEKETSIQDIAGFKFSAIFICLPTPSKEDGTIDSSIIDSVLNFIEKNVTYEVIVIKSTVTPDLVSLYCQNPKVVYNPEFLTERNAASDFKSSKFHIIGSNSQASSIFLEHIYKTKFQLNSNANFIHIRPEEASFVKYGINSYLASKVAWFNEFYDIALGFGLNQTSFDTIVNTMACDLRVGDTHMNVPGWDGRRGFGGACFPKDIPAFLHFAKKQLGKFPPILKSVWNFNTKLRNDQPLLSREVEQNIKYEQV